MRKEKQHSRKSVRNFVKAFLSVEPPDFFFHQTLTFHPKVFDVKIAKKRLKKLLEQSLFGGLIYVQEHHAKDGVHFHLLLYFYGENLPFPPSKLEEQIRARIFEAWNRLNGGSLVQVGNALEVRKPDLGTVRYFVELYLPEGSSGTGAGKWWGIRNGAKLKFRQPPPTKPEVTDFLDRLFPKARSSGRFTTRATERVKKEILEASLEPDERDWEQYKQTATGRTDSVSDSEYMADGRKRERDWKKKHFARTADLA